MSWLACTPCLQLIVASVQVYALRPDRQRAVALETLQVWCSLAERLGMFALKVNFLLFMSFSAWAFHVLTGPLPLLACSAGNQAPQEAGVPGGRCIR